MSITVESTQGVNGCLLYHSFNFSESLKFLEWGGGKWISRKKWKHINLAPYDTTSILLTRTMSHWSLISWYPVHLIWSDQQMLIENTTTNISWALNTCWAVQRAFHPWRYQILTPHLREVLFLSPCYQWRNWVLEVKLFLQATELPVARQSFQLFDSKASNWLLCASAVGSQNLMCIIKIYPGNFYKMHAPGPLPQVWDGAKPGAFWGGRPRVTDANGKQTTCQDRLLKGLTEWQRAGSRNPWEGLETTVHTWLEQPVKCD